MNKEEIEIVHLASPFKGNIDEELQRCIKSKKKLEKLGLKVNLEFIHRCKHYENLTPIEKKIKLEKAFIDENVKYIMSYRGGYSSVKVLEYLDYDLIKNNYKPIIGYSDITAVLNFIAKKCNVITFHGPMFITIKINDEKSFINLFEIIRNKNLFGYIYEKKFEVLNYGNAIGKLYGGNLSIICSLIGTEYELCLENTILFIEDINEPDYKIDRMLTQLDLAGYFEKAKGIIFGKFKNCTEVDTPDELSVKTIIKSIINKYNKPVIFNFNSSHKMEMKTLPIGGLIEIEGNKIKIIDERTK